jgi:hypothetical protein
MFHAVISVRGALIIVIEYDATDIFERTDNEKPNPFALFMMLRP